MGGMPLGQRGPAKVMIYDIHALQVRFYFSDTVLPVLLTAIPLLKRVLAKRYVDPQKELVITFPDDGACKRFARYFEGYELVICAKVRDGDKRVVKLKDGNVAGRPTLIVDDLVQTGGTLIECTHALRAAGATAISCFVTHAVFPRDSWKRFTTSSADPAAADSGPAGEHAPPLNLDTFYVTDSCTDTVKKLRGHHPFQVISLAADIVRRLLQHTI
jgi:phosphoribosylpyrophosphate synthetase